MPAYKDTVTGKWFVKFYCKNWKGENKQIKKRGFDTKREALEYERHYKVREEGDLDMPLGEFFKLYKGLLALVDEIPNGIGGLRRKKKLAPFPWHDMVSSGINWVPTKSIYPYWNIKSRNGQKRCSS